MHPLNTFLILPILLLVSFSIFSLAWGQQCGSLIKPQTIFTKSQLPIEDHGMTAIYDGDDSIMIFSGNEEANRTIFRFNIGSEEVDRFLPIPFKGVYAPVTQLRDGTYLYLGNDRVAPRILKFDLTTNSSSIVAELPYNLPIRTTFTSPDLSTLYLVAISGVNASIFELDTTSYDLTLVKNITDASNYVTSAILGNDVHIFMGQQRTTKALQIDRATLDVTMLEGINLEFSVGIAGAVATNKYVYIFGGYKRGSPFPLDGVLQYSPGNSEFKFVRIEWIPQGFLGGYEYPPGMVFVEKLNRIYFFGGRMNKYEYNYVPVNHIWYIDVGMMEA